VFQHDKPTHIVRAISRIVHDNASVEEGLQELER
jgi:DhnA family fructose-bisphosphate aldolase class Ia